MKTGDRISQLPDGVLHEILYFLGMNEAVKTCVLSKRWRYLWTPLPYLRFDYYPYSLRNPKYNPHRPPGNLAFNKFINQVVLRHNSSSQIVKLCLNNLVVDMEVVRSTTGDRTNVPTAQISESDIQNIRKARATIKRDV